MHPGRGSAKQVTRREVRSRRAARGVRDGQEEAVLLAGHVEALTRLAAGDRAGSRALTVAAYVSLPGEPTTTALRQRLVQLGHRVLLPWLQDDRDLDWVVDRGEDRDGGALPDPLRPPGPRLGPGAVRGVDLVLVPALAVDGDGTRLGQGGGSYDRALVRLTGTPDATGRSPRPPVLAVVDDEELLPSGTLPREAHDVPVDGALTPSGLHLLPP